MKTETILGTRLLESHIELGAKMLPFGGYNMPINYKKGIRHVEAFQNIIRQNQ